MSQLLDNGLDLPDGVTLLIGENRSGKSTIVEAVAMAFGPSARTSWKLANGGCLTPQLRGARMRRISTVNEADLNGGWGGSSGR